jgi:hypothetical protein
MSIGMVVAFIASALFVGSKTIPKAIDQVSRTNQYNLLLITVLGVAFAVIGTSITLFPIIRKLNESMALGYVCFRLLEAAIIVVSIIRLLSVVTLTQEFAEAVDPNAPSFLTAGNPLVAVHDWTFLFGLGFVLAPSTMMLAYLLYKSRLVPRFIPVLGLIGGPWIFVSALAIMFGLYDQFSLWSSIATIAVFA